MTTSRTTNAEKSADGSMVRVLIIDDEPDGASVLCIMLNNCGYSVEIVTDARQAIEHLRSFLPDIVLLDIAMPRICGYELAKQIRLQPEFENVAIVALSGYADSKHKKWSFESGCDQYLVKPFELATVEAAIAQEVEKRHLSAALAAYERV